MCGIAGIISVNPTNVSKRRLQQMTDAIRHRGPEGDGFWLNNNNTVGFGHRRLSIIDLSPAGAQPMHYNNRFTITYNGELYNYLEVKQQLQVQGFSFNSISDTEVILAAYACYGNDCLQYFDGMFAFAIWDSENQTLFCARDRFGEKPFYFIETQGQLLFASEMKALWAAGVPKQVHTGMLLNYITPGITANPQNQFQTFFKNISSLPAAHYLQLQFSDDAVNSYSIHVNSYWDIDKQTLRTLSEESATEEFLHLLKTSITRRLRSDVAVGTSLSGGLDSASLAALINASLPKNSNYKQATFSAIFPGFIHDESEKIQQLTSHFCLQSFTVSPDANDLVADIEKLMYHQEEPFQSSSVYIQYKVYELAKKHGVTVLLDGQGPDETLAGYLKYYPWYWQELVASGKRKTAMQEIQVAKQIGVPVTWSFTNFAAAYLPAFTAKYLEQRAMRKQAAHSYLNHDYFAADERIRLHKPVTEKLNDLLYYDTMQLGLHELLRYADRNSMAHSREVRLPFLSHELVQFVFSLPASFKIKDGFTKWILRKSMHNLLPSEIVWQTKKIGFEPPQQQWMQHPDIKEYIYESRRTLVKKGVLTSKVLNEPIGALPAHEADNYDWRYLCAAHCM